MPSRAGGPAYAGVSLTPSGSDAVVVRDVATARVPNIPRTDDDVEVLMAHVMAAAHGVLEAITIDISQVLLDAVLRAAPELPPIAVIRIVPRPATDPVLARSPARLVEQLISRRFTVAGGHDLLGHELCPLDQQALLAVCENLVTLGIRDVAIVGAGSQASPVHEQTVANFIQASLPQARIAVASDFGGQGLVAREATVALDCALGPLTERLLVRWERALATMAPDVSLRVARGDGGYSTSSRVRSLPVVTLGATDAMQLAGAAHLQSSTDCRVLLPRPDGQMAGDVRHGLVAIRSGQLSPFGVELVVPTAVLTPDRGVESADGLRRVTDVPLVLADRDPDELACVGAAVSRPTSWLDEFAFIESASELAKVRRDAEERAFAIVMANGAAPGTAYIAEISAIAVPYSPPGTVRVRVRVAGAPDTDPRRIAVSDRVAP